MTRTQDLATAQQAFSAGDYALTHRLAARIVAEAPGLLTAQALLANAANALRRFAEAVAALDALHAALPADAGIRRALAMASNNAGSQLFEQGQLHAAVRLYARAIELDPASTLASMNLAVCATKLRQHDVALQSWQRVLAIDALDVDAALGSARALRALGRDTAADGTLDELARRSLSFEQSLALALEFERCGHAKRAGQLAAGTGLDRDPAACMQLAAMEKLCGNIVAARKHLLFAAGHARNRGDERACFRAERDAALLIASVFATRSDVDLARADYAQHLDGLIASWPASRLVEIGAQLDDLRAARFTLAYQGEDDLALATRYGKWLSTAAQALHGSTAAIETSQPIRRIGLVSARWTQGTVAAYFGSWIAALRTLGTDVYLYTLSGIDDETSHYLAAQASQAKRLPADISGAASQLIADRIDLLLYPEIGLDAGCEILAALRLAPRQWAAWGHPVTTGLPTIDRYLSVAAMEPADATSDYSEQLCLLPGIGTAYARATTVPGNRPALHLPENAGLYLLPHSPLKLHPDSDGIVADILRGDENARVIFVADETPALTLAHRHRLEAHLSGHDGDLASRVLWLPRLPIEGFRQLLASVDIVIDSLHFSGGNTSLDVIAQNTPILTVEGRRMRGRQTAAMLRMVDLSELICTDANQLAVHAIDIVGDKHRMARLRTMLSERSDRLFDQRAPLQALCDLVGGE